MQAGGRAGAAAGEIIASLAQEEPAMISGLSAAAIACAIDQASKLWLLHGFDLAARVGYRHLSGGQVRRPRLDTLFPRG